MKRGLNKFIAWVLAVGVSASAFLGIAENPHVESPPSPVYAVEAQAQTTNVHAKVVKFSATDSGEKINV